MADYKKMYLDLFNGITDVIEQLKQLQMDAEEHFIQSEEVEEEENPE